MFPSTAFIMRMREPLQCFMRKWQLVPARRMNSTQAGARADMTTASENIHSDMDTDDHGEDIYSFTRGRFVANEGHEMAIRYKQFNAVELGKVAAEAVGSRECAKLVKHADGMCNKVFFLTMDDGKEVVAKIPNTNAGPPHYITASEVATMEYVRKVLQTPVPKVLAWCSRAEQTAVQAEYIIMDKARGVSLENFYSSMDVSDRYTILQALARYQVTWAEPRLEGYGSLYYDTDLNDKEGLQQSAPLTERHTGSSNFTIGPTTARDWYEDGRVSVDCDRGPWRTAESYLQAIGHREMSCVKHLTQLPFSSLTLHGPGTYMRSREKKAQAIDHYLDLLDTISPKDDVVKRSCLWHGDLHTDNIFVDPENPTVITDIIDWQSVDAAPLFVQMRQPCFLDYEGPQVTGLEEPKLPANLEELPPEEQTQAKVLFNLASLSALYRLWLHVHNPDAWKGVQFQDTSAHSLLLLARKLFNEGEALYMAKLVNLAESQPKSSSGKRLTFSDDERSEIAAATERTIRGMDAMSGIKEALGDLFPERGILATHEEYEEVQDALRQVKAQVIEQYATTEKERETWEQVWPWDN